MGLGWLGAVKVSLTAAGSQSDLLLHSTMGAVLEMEQTVECSASSGASGTKSNECLRFLLQRRRTKWPFAVTAKRVQVPSTFK